MIRDDRAPGNIVGRNRLVREASAPSVLLMDDDAALVSADPIERALRLLETDRQLGAIAFAQCAADGTRWDEGMQPGRSDVSCILPAFIGFAHMLRRDVFTTIGGYRESFVYYGEEKELCLRLIEAGYRTLYLPDALVIHEPDPVGSQPATAPALRNAQRLPRGALQRAAQQARMVVPGAAGAVFSHAPRMEYRRSVGLGVDTRGPLETPRFRVPRSKASVASDAPDVESPANRSTTVRITDSEP